jgi:hypothetical protein
LRARAALELTDPELLRAHDIGQERDIVGQLQDRRPGDNLLLPKASGKRPAAIPDLRGLEFRIHTQP